MSRKVITFYIVKSGHDLLYDNIVTYDMKSSWPFAYKGHDLLYIKVMTSCI